MKLNTQQTSIIMHLQLVIAYNVAITREIHKLPTQLHITVQLNKHTNCSTADILENRYKWPA